MSFKGEYRLQTNRSVDSLSRQQNNKSEIITEISLLFPVGRLLVQQNRLEKSVFSLPLSFFYFKFRGRDRNIKFPMSLSMPSFTMPKFIKIISAEIKSDRVNLAFRQVHYFSRDIEIKKLLHKVEYYLNLYQISSKLVQEKNNYLPD